MQGPATSVFDRPATANPQSPFDVADSKNVNDLNPVPSGAMDSSLERLKAALDEDEQLAKSPPRPLGGPHDARVRVDSLLDRAKRLFASGRLREARQTAQIAQDLGDSARIDFSPDEERPVDLLDRIDDQIHETQRTTTTSAPTETGRDASAPGEAGGLLRTGRDWVSGLNVFRRDRRHESVGAGGPPPPAVPAVPIPPASPANSVRVHLELEVDAPSTTESGKAVVQANRSVVPTEANPEDESVRQGSRSRPESSTLIRYAPATSAESESVEEPRNPADPELSPPDPQGEIAWDRSANDDTGHEPAEDEEASPAVEGVRPIARFHDIARKPRLARSIPTDEQLAKCERPWGWIAIAIAFGVCGIFAFFGYRRGAT